MKGNAKREGFTLVELLIVIVVIGVLSAMMMLSSTEAVSSAKAASIVNNLRNLKTAALAWYADNNDRVNAVGGIKKDDNDTEYKGRFASATNNANDYPATITAQMLLKYLGNSAGLTNGTYGSLQDSSGGIYYTDWTGKTVNSKSYYVGISSIRCLIIMTIA